MPDSDIMCAINNLSVVDCELSPANHGKQRIDTRATEMGYVFGGRKGATWRYTLQMTRLTKPC